MWIDPGLQRLARRGSAVILAAFRDYQWEFQGITRRAKSRFEHREWRGGQRDAVERLELYGRAIARIEDTIRELLGPMLHERRLWALMKADFSQRNRAIPALEGRDLLQLGHPPHLRHGGRRPRGRVPVLRLRRAAARGRRPGGVLDLPGPGAGTAPHGH
jgi:hypothetical protein